MKRETLAYLEKHLSGKNLDFFEEELIKLNVNSQFIISCFFDKKKKTINCVLKNGKVIIVKIKKAWKKYSKLFLWSVYFIY